MLSRLNLTITPPAREGLNTLIKEEIGFDAVPSVVWATDTKSGRSYWMIGFYERSKVAEDFFVDAGGVELVVEPQWRRDLDGKQLELSNGYFVIREKGEK